MQHKQHSSLFVEQLFTNWSRLITESTYVDRKLYMKMQMEVADLLGRLAVVRSISDVHGIRRLTSNSSQSVLEPSVYPLNVTGRFSTYVSGRSQLPRLLLDEVVDVGTPQIAEILPISSIGERLVTIDLLD